MLDKKELTLTLDDFRQTFHLPQATTNNHNSFMPPPSFSDMVPFYKQVLGYTMELKTQSNFKTTGLLQPWQTLNALSPIQEYKVGIAGYSSGLISDVLKHTESFFRCNMRGVWDRCYSDSKLLKSSAPDDQTMIRLHIPDIGDPHVLTQPAPFSANLDQEDDDDFYKYITS
ncbi:hypothetical protein Tco_1476051 [Tanacetum coccineum]